MVSSISINTDNSMFYKSFVCIQVNDFKYWYVSLTLQLKVSHLFTHSQIIKQLYLLQFTLMSSVCTQFKCRTGFFDL